MVFWSLYLLATLLGVIYFWNCNRNGKGPTKKKNRRLHGPGEYFLGGIFNILALKDMKSSVFETWCGKYGPVFKVRFGPYPFTILNSADYAQKLLGSKDMNYFGNGFVYKPFKPYWDDGLIISRGEKWKSRRRLLEKHMFSFKTLLGYMKIFNAESEILLQKIGGLFADGEEKGIEHLLMSSSLQVVTNAAVGKKSEGIDMYDKESGITFIKGLDRAKEIIAIRITSPWLLADSVWRHHPLSKIEKLLVTVGKRITMRAIDDQSLKNNNNKVGIKECMTAAGNNIEGVIEESLTLITAGYETTATSMHFLLLFLALYPEHQEKCREEVDAIFEDVELCPSGVLQFRALGKLKYLEMCLYETLRLLPTVFMIMRKIDAPLELEEDLVLERGSEVAICLQGIHKNPEYFPEPEKFRPERFSMEESKARHPYAFIPFSGGPRGCIGQKFAMMEMLTFSANILRQYEWTTGEMLEDIIFLPHITLTPEKPIKFIFKGRIFK